MRIISHVKTRYCLTKKAIETLRYCCNFHEYDALKALQGYNFRAEAAFLAAVAQCLRYPLKEDDRSIILGSEKYYG
jgi:hypothetical protein